MSRCAIKSSMSVSAIKGVFRSFCFSHPILDAIKFVGRDRVKVVSVLR